MASRLPDRIDWAVETLAVRGSDSLLEIGCGRGVAVPFIAAAHLVIFVVYLFTAIVP